MLQKLNYALDYFRYLNNPIEALKVRFGLKKEVNLKIKDLDYEMTIKNVSLLNVVMYYVAKITNNKKRQEFYNLLKQINEGKETVTIDGISYLNLWGGGVCRKKSNYGG